MAEKTLNNVRIVNKHETETNWQKSSFVPKQGELIVYDIDSTHSYERIKIGDGKTNVNALPFIDANKVDKVSGKGLSTNDYTTAEKTKLSGIAEGANKTVVDTAMSSTSTNPVQNKVVNAAIGAVSTLVGDKKVSEQISAAIASKSDTGHTHNYAGSSSAGGAANSVKANLTVKLNGGSTEGTNLFTYNGSTAKTFNITPSAIGAAASSHGNHVPTTETANNAKFLRNDNTWQTVTPANIGAATTNHGTHVSYSTTAPVMDGTASVGSASTVARSDHKHPTDTSRAAASDLTTLQVLVGDTKVSTQIENAIGKITHPVTSINSKTGVVTLAASDVGAVPTTRTVNGKALSSNITLSASDIGAAASSHGTHVTFGTDTPKVASTASVGTATTVSRSDHVHPAQTNISGNAATATKATQDASGNVITSTYATKSALNAVSNLVGDKSVSDQIEAAQIVYVGPTKPTDPNIKVWINTAEEGTGVVPVMPRVSTISLPKASWTGSASPYYQTVTINTVTSSTKIDLQPTVAQITSLQDADIALMAENTNGTVKVYSFGGKPSADMTMQVLLTEVSYV